MKRKDFFSVVLLFSVLTANAQQKQMQQNPLRKGKLYAYWGWNRGAYSKSNISLKGADYNIKLYSVKAHDRPISPNYYDYLKLNRITIPQTNFRVGYFVKNNIAVGVGVDHMKYVMMQNQKALVKGVITRPGLYAKHYDGEQLLSEDFLTFEHTDGLNYVNATVEKYKPLLKSKSERVLVEAYYGGGVGVLLPKTNVKLLDYERNDRFHLSGFGANISGGLQLVFFKRIIMRMESKLGYINMPDIILHKKGIPGKGKQHFLFAEGFVALGGSFSF